MNSITATAYNPQTNGQTEHFNSTLLLRLRHYVSQHQTDWNTYLLPLTYAYKLQAYRLIKVSLFSLAPMRTPSRPATVVSIRASLEPVVDMASPTYTTVELLKRATDLRQETDKNLRLAQKRYKKDYDGRVRFTPIFRVDDYVFSNRPPLYRSTVERSASERYSKLLPWKQRPYKVIGVGCNTLQVIQDGLKTQFPSTGLPLAPRQGAIGTMSLPTRMISPVGKSATRTEESTNIEKKTETPTLSTNFCDTSIPHPSSAMRWDGTGAVGRTAPPDPLLSPPPPYYIP